MAMAVVSTAGIFGGCGKNNVDTPEHLEIKMYKAGNGTESVKKVAERFMELNSGKTVEIVENTEPRIVEDEINYGPSLNTVDLYLAGGSFFNISDKGEKVIDGVTYENAFVSLDDVWESAPYGETTLIKDKVYSAFTEYYYTSEKSSGKHSYYMPWIGDWQGIVYNSKMFEKYNWTVPVTTDEMFELADKICAVTAKSTNKNSLNKDIKISPFTYSREDSYWGTVMDEWWIQYEGLENYYLFGQGKNAAGEYSPDIVTSQGILESMKVIDKVLGTYYKDSDGQIKARTNVYTDNTLSFRTYTDIQSTFLYGEEARINASGATTAAMMPNGGWLENEMSSNFAEEISSGKVAFKAMKTPVISAIADKTTFKNAENRDLKLRELIKWIDSGKSGEKPAFASEEDVKIVEAARNVVTPQSTAVMIIPSYSSSIELAKEFIKFLYSDEAARIFITETKGIELPVSCDYSGVELSDFQKSKFAITAKDNVNFVMNIAKYPMTYTGALPVFNNPSEYGTVTANLAVSNPKDYKTVEEMFLMNYKTASNGWQQKLIDAGVIK